jgi:hypothetical protein
LPTVNKVRENKARRAAERQGLRLVKSRRRDPRALDFGLYSLVSIETDAVVCSPRWITLDAVENHLDNPRGR